MKAPATGGDGSAVPEFGRDGAAGDLRGVSGGLFEHTNFVRQSVVYGSSAPSAFEIRLCVLKGRPKAQIQNNFFTGLDAAKEAPSRREKRSDNGSRASRSKSDGNSTQLCALFRGSLFEVNSVGYRLVVLETLSILAVSDPQTAN
ncbi:conserved hypothetical protein [Culex quinquefasciatus]|uniref:Uncharacterized protein n=1 Tax=Culex quinquefasciatus TaxID=7176 RepID=B0XLK2_CULQU|nr:conserved hypothetical protein [Culex quinquefasciatus]|eukprot:XP_001870524.1 conserved hypothetical protein [Culex quinquefasciatus]